MIRRITGYYILPRLEAVMLERETNLGEVKKKELMYRGPFGPKPSEVRICQELCLHSQPDFWSN